MAASDATEEQRRALREELKGQIASMRALEEEAEKEKAEQRELLTRIAAMESKVGCCSSGGHCMSGSRTSVCTNPAIRHSLLCAPAVCG
jgi:hypothetical protein